MVDEIEEKKQKKLTLGPRKLSLNKNVTTASLKSIIAKTKSSTVTVEVRNNKSTLSASRKLSTSGDAGGNLSNTEVNQRMNLLKKANQDNAIKQQEKEILAQKKAQRAEEEAKRVEERNAIIIAEENHPTLELPQANKKSLDKPKAKNFNDEDDREAVSKKKEAEKETHKPKQDAPRKIKNSDLYNMLDEDGGAPRERSLAAVKRAREKEKRKQQQMQKPNERIYREVIVPETITVGELANRMTERAADVIRELMKLGIMATSSQTIDADTAEIIISTFGHAIKRVEENEVENIFEEDTDHPDDLTPRAPIVTVMGHVDHGKTSLLDALKSTDIASGEVGGITQHIGAYRIEVPNGHITFIDTPGHEAFTEMRSRGAKVTDIVILVVAADDGIKAQTIEAINHAKAAEVPIIVAVNKIDKPDADIERVNNELLSQELIPEDIGGDIVVVPVSALQRTNLDKLEEAVLLVAEMMELKSNAKVEASGIVVESSISQSKGAMVTVLVQRGTLKQGDIIVAGTSFGKIKVMSDDKGRKKSTAEPSVPVEVMGFDSAPAAGEKFAIVATEKQARDVIDYRMHKLRDTKGSSATKVTLEDLFAATGEGKITELPVIIKGDVQGSIEAIIGSLNKLSESNDEVKVKVLHSAAGGVSESDVTLAVSNGSIIVCLNVRSNNNASLQAEKNAIDIRYYSIIYNLIDDMKILMSGMLKPIIREEYIGSVDIREVFNITKVGKIAGSYVTRGKIRRGAGVRLLRDDIVIYEGKLKTLKRFKDDVKEVAENFECGISFENYDDIKVGDKVEVFDIIEEMQQL